jgi:hypothetical protein
MESGSFYSTVPPMFCSAMARPASPHEQAVQGAQGVEEPSRRHCRAPEMDLRHVEAPPLEPGRIIAPDVHRVACHDPDRGVNRLEQLEGERRCLNWAFFACQHSVHESQPALDLGRTLSAAPSER